MKIVAHPSWPADRVVVIGEADAAAMVNAVLKECGINGGVLPGRGLEALNHIASAIESRPREPSA